MIKEEIKRFAESGVKSVNIIALKQDGFIGGKYTFYINSYIEELPGIICRTDSWDEDLMLKKMSQAYENFKSYISRESIFLPEKVEFFIEYITEEQWFQKYKK